MAYVAKTLAVVALMIAKPATGQQRAEQTVFVFPTLPDLLVEIPVRLVAPKTHATV